MMNEKRTLTVSILGKNYSLVTDEKSDVVENAAQMVEALMKQLVHTATSPTEMAKKTTFVALQIAVDLIKQQASSRLIDGKVTTLNSLLKEQLG
jgi:cell division protein ZapA (FtsZ GTPase activity inhibitor)